MGSISSIQAQEMLARLARNRKREPVVEHHVQTGVDRESKLHESILGYCRSQWPRWKVIHCRMDKRSTVEVGVHDITVFMPDGRTLCVECKAKNKKLTEDQLAWKMEMAMLGHTVYEVRSFDEFLSVVDDRKASNG